MFHYTGALASEFEFRKSPNAKGICPAQVQRCSHGRLGFLPGTGLYCSSEQAAAPLPSMHSSGGFERLLLGLHVIPLLPTVSGPLGDCGEQL